MNSPLFLPKLKKELFTKNLVFYHIIIQAF